MGLFSTHGLSRSQIKDLAAQADCSPKAMRNRVKAACQNGLDAQALIDQELFNLTTVELTRYLTKAKPRSYVDVIVARDGLSSYEAYRQMKRAKQEFGISYAYFASKNLANASDEMLRKESEHIRKKTNKTLRRIANAMDVSMEEAQQTVDRIRKQYGYSAKGIYYRQLYLMSDEELEAYVEKEKEARARTIERIQAETGWSKEQVRAHINHCEADFGVDPDVYYVCRCYTLTDEQLAQCGTMRDSRKIGARFNKGKGKLLNNKRLFNETYKDYIGRKFWYNRNTSFGEFERFVEGLTTLFCKPVDLSLGCGTSKIELEGRDLHQLYEWFLEQPVLLVEECLTQHPAMAEFFPQTLNTVRLFTVLDNGEFDAFASFVRFGVKGITDNFSAGGIGCGVDPKTGVVLTKGYTKQGDVFDIHPITGKQFEGFQIPHWDLILERAEAALRAVDGVDYVGWDIAIRDDDIVFVEGNAAPDLGIQQALFIQQGIFIKPSYKKYLDPEGSRSEVIDG